LQPGRNDLVLQQVIEQNGAIYAELLAIKAKLDALLAAKGGA
jgi:hypothetical protein